MALFGYYMRHLDYYDGLGIDELNFDTELILFVEAKYYYDSEKTRWIKRCELKNRIDDILAYFTNGKQTEIANGTLGRLVESLSDPSKPKKYRFLGYDNRGKKNTWIYLNIRLIESELEKRKKRNSEIYGLTLVRFKNKLDHLGRGVPELIESVPISDKVTKTVKMLEI
jgi:hypothetical protein